MSKLEHSHACLTVSEKKCVCHVRILEATKALARVVARARASWIHHVCSQEILEVLAAYEAARGRTEDK